jgi:hypothetical protein
MEPRCILASQFMPLGSQEKTVLRKSLLWIIKSQLVINHATGIIFVGNHLSFIRWKCLTFINLLKHSKHFYLCAISPPRQHLITFSNCDFLNFKWPQA